MRRKDIPLLLSSAAILFGCARPSKTTENHQIQLNVQPPPITRFIDYRAGEIPIVDGTRFQDCFTPPPDHPELFSRFCSQVINDGQPTDAVYDVGTDYVHPTKPNKLIRSEGFSDTNPITQTVRSAVVRPDGRTVYLESHHGFTFGDQGSGYNLVAVFDYLVEEVYHGDTDLVLKLLAGTGIERNQLDKGSSVIGNRNFRLRHARLISVVSSNGYSLNVGEFFGTDPDFQDAYRFSFPYSRPEFWHACDGDGSEKYPGQYYYDNGNPKRFLVMQVEPTSPNACFINR